jgi:hypothetical protein
MNKQQSEPLQVALADYEAWTQKDPERAPAHRAVRNHAVGRELEPFEFADGGASVAR